MGKLNRCIGLNGESIAIDFLIKNNYKVLDTNFYCSAGEIDIISYDTNQKCICIIEVKSRYSNLYGLPLESITPYKQKKLLNSTRFYLHKKRLFDINIRFDIIEVYFNLDKTHKINHIKNVLIC